MCDNTAVKPNDGDIKVYIFEKADTLRPDAQNALLKNIDEPQPWVKFIFICESSASLHTTIRSRVTEYSMPECPEEECAKCLAEQYGVDKKAALDNARMMNGNIGRCLEALNGGDELKLMESAKRAATGIAKRSGYLLCTALGEQTGRRDSRKAAQGAQPLVRSGATQTARTFGSPGRSLAERTIHGRRPCIEVRPLFQRDFCRFRLCSVFPLFFRSFAGTLGKILRTFDHDCPEALLAVTAASAA